MPRKKCRCLVQKTGESLFDQLSTLGGPLLLKTLEEIENGEVKPVKQKDEESTYAKMLTREMGELDFQEEAVRLRALCAWFEFVAECVYALSWKTAQDLGS